MILIFTKYSVQQFFRNNDTPNRNKSPPLKKTRRKEQGGNIGSMGSMGNTSQQQNSNNNANNSQQQQQQPLRVLGSATNTVGSSDSGKSDRINWPSEQGHDNRFTFLGKEKSHGQAK